MNVVELDDVMARLQEVLELYGKKATDGGYRYWRRMLVEKNKDDCLRALDEYVSKNKYAPKPCNIDDLIAGYRHRNEDGSARPDRCVSASPETQRAFNMEQSATPMSDRTATAWNILHNLQHGHDLPRMVIRKVNAVEMTREQAIEICNEQAARLNIPDAIDPRFRINDYWD